VRLGFAVKVLGGGGLPSHDTRRWQSGPHLSTSLAYLTDILRYCRHERIGMYRMATALAPYASHPELPQFHHQVEECQGELAAAGAMAQECGVRLSTHPGQYTVLNSEAAVTRRNAVAELEVQAALMDAMALPPESVVVLHVGGAAGGVKSGAERFLRGFEELSEPARARLVLENDDRSYGIVAATEIARRAGVRVVFDVLHHHCHDPDGLSDRQALELALGTWPADVRPKVHFSSPRLDVTERKKRVGRRVERARVLPDLRAHADLVDPMAFEHFLASTAAGLRDFDVMLEAKAKDLALLRLREQLERRGAARSPGAPVPPSVA
jgi:UV DNA damage endonuclease